MSLLCFRLCGQNWDVDLAKAINPRDPNSTIWRTTSNSVYVLGAVVPVCFVVTGLSSKDPRVKRRTWLILGTVVGELVFSEALKYAIDRERPGDKYPGIIFPYSPTHGYSFPSGHASLAFSLAAGLSFEYKKWYITVPAYLWASAAGFSRVYLGVHYPSDVLAGAVVGVGSAYLVRWLRRRGFF
jgi:membrane-associated phospholipid phosphatase